MLYAPGVIWPGLVPSAYWRWTVNTLHSPGVQVPVAPLSAATSVKNCWISPSFVGTPPPGEPWKANPAGA